MEWYEALILGLLQGLTEFLPVSSSGHLEIGQELFGVSGDGNLLFDITVHMATVLSTMVVLWKPLWEIIRSCCSTWAWNEGKVYAAKIVVSMIPVFIVGVFFKDVVEEFFGNGILLVGICLWVTAALLAFAHFARPREREDISYLHALVIGLAQAVAVLPGLSRSGSTIATGLLLGNKKETVAQFSFLMVLVPVLGEALLEGLKVAKEPALVADGLGWTALAVGFVAAFAAGCLACRFMLEIVRRQKLIWFALYCVLVGTFAIVWSFC